MEQVAVVAEARTDGRAGGRTSIVELVDEKHESESERRASRGLDRKSVV